MEKINLNQRAKRILPLMVNHKYNIIMEDTATLLDLESYGLINTTKLTDGTIWTYSLTDKGKAYIELNPKLSNPSIWGDKKWLITTIVAIAAIVVSITIEIITNK